MAHPYLEKLTILLREFDSGDSDVVCKHFFSGAAAYVDSRIFATLTPHGLALKLPGPRCEELMLQGFAEPLCYFKKSPVKRGYVLFSAYAELNQADVNEYIRESQSFVAQNST